MKKIAILMTLVMVITCIIPVAAPMDAAAATTHPWSGWQRSNTSYSGTTLTMDGSAEARQTMNIPDNFDVSFSLRISEWGTGSYQGAYFCTGKHRAGIYVYQDRIWDFNGKFWMHNTDTNWHTYQLKVRGEAFDIYIDGTYFATGTCQDNSWGQFAYFFTSAATLEDSVQVKDFSITKPDGSDLSPMILTAPVETEYAQEFTTNWATSTDGWTITDCDEIFVNSKGNIEFKIKDESGYFQVERAPKTPDDFDVDFGLQIHNYGSESIILKAATNGYNNYHYLSPDRIRAVSAETSSTGDYGILTDIGNDWHHWKFEVRGAYVTIYMDGGQVTRYRMPASSGLKPLIRIMVEAVGNENCHMELGNIHYKPYFPEISLSAPVNGETFTEGSNITFKASVTESVDYVDFFVNGLNVGKGYSPDYEYVLKNAKHGTYRVSAGMGQVGDVESIVTVKSATSESVVEGNNSAREYMLDYSFDGGQGEVRIGDGYFELNMIHSDNSVTVKTLDGSESFSLGQGKYRIVTTSGYGMIYYNGHFAGSFLMPRTSGVAVEYSGVSGFTKSETGVKGLVFEEAWSQKSEYRKRIENIGHNYSIEFDKTDLSDENMVLFDGFYKLDLSMIDGALVAVMQNTSGGEDDIVLEGDVSEGYWRITVAKGLAQVWCNNVYKGSFAMPSNPRPAELIRTMKNPMASTIVSIKNTDDLFYHSEDFEGNTELDSLDYWLSDGGMATVENGEMTINGGAYLLNGQSYNVNAKWSAKLSETSDFYVTARRFKNWYDLKVGYDFNKGIWYIDEWSEFGSFKTDKRTKFSGTAPSMGVWHDFELILEDSYIELVCDGVTVAKKENLNFPLNGYMGFGVTDGSATIDNLEYEGRCAVTAAVKSATISDQVGIAEIWEDKTGAVYIQSNGHIKTTDGGETWSDYVYVSSTSIENRIRLNDGRLMELRGTELTNPLEIWVSSDDAKTWTRAGYMNADDDQRRVVLTGSITQAKNGRVFICPGFGFSEYGTINKLATYYSDDLKNWYMSPSVNDSGVTGLNLQEGSHVELPDGTIRWYARSGDGFIMYCDSSDNGVTYDEWRPSQLISPLCTYAVERDNVDPNTYWAIMQYDATTYDYRYQHRPRNRFALMVSYDGMESWEFVATLNEQSEFPSYDACNHVLRVFGDTVYIQWNNLHTPRRSITYAIDKNKVRTQKRFEEVHERYNWGESSGTYTDTLCFVPKTSGTAVLYGKDTAVVISDGRYDAETVAKIFGATAKVNVNNIVFNIGDGEVVFTEGANTYTVNGETRSFGEVCLSMGYLDINACAEAFGKNISDMDDSYILWSDEVASSSYLNEYMNYPQTSGTGVEDMTGTMFGGKHLLYVQDYESDKRGVTIEAAPGSSYDYYDDILTVVDDGTGNKVLDITITDNTSGTSYSFDGFATSQATGNEHGFDINLKNGAVVTYDILKKDDGVAIGVELADNDDGGRGIVVIPASAMPQKDKWYTVETRFADGVSPQVIVYDRETGIGTEVECITSSNIIGSGNYNRMRIISDSRYAAFTDNITTESGKNAFTTHYWLDNVKLYNQTAKLTSGVVFSNDCETQKGFLGTFTPSYGVEDNNTYQIMERTVEQGHTWGRYDVNGDVATMPTDNYQLTVDVCKLALGHSLSLQMYSTNWDGWIIPANDVEIGAWYTYKFVEENGVKKAYRKLKTEAEYSEIAVVTDNPDNHEAPVVKSQTLPISNSWTNYFALAIEATQSNVGNDPTSTGASLTGLGSKWATDNLVVSQLGAAEVEYFSEHDKVYNKLNVFSADVEQNEFMPIIGYFDASGNLLGTDFAGNADMSFGKGESQQFMMYTVGKLFRKVKEENGKARAFFWNADGQPIAEDIDITGTL